ncbi:Ig-like domain-containing protein [Anaerosporobacter sp.]|uniref:Ig-like domain-containing protein n=1 Tax=Anaerosporobacter sp. TaxID=1872529 RepID=UPI00286EFB39|nr:Ig-like domain-containing protein [Anaerosporobacter sp.]
MKKTKKRVIGLVLLVFILLGSSTIMMPINSITVEAAKKVALNKTNAVLIKGQSLQLKLPNSKGVIWKSSKKSVATVNKSGKVIAKAKGVAYITATYNNRDYVCVITVETPKISKNELQLIEGEKSTLKVSGTSQKITWSSSDKSIATVDKGNVVALHFGEAIITAKVGSKEYNCLLTVQEKEIILIEDFTITDTIQIRVGKTAELKPICTPSNTTEQFTPNYTSSNNNVAQVTNDGIVKPISAGTALITVSFKDIEKIVTVSVLDSKEQLLANEDKRYREEVAEIERDYKTSLSNLDTKIWTIKYNRTVYYGSYDEYIQELNALVKEITNLEKTLNALSGDTSLENQKRLRQTRASLATAENKLDDLEERWSAKTDIETLETLKRTFTTLYYDELGNAETIHNNNIDAIKAQAE